MGRESFLQIIEDVQIKNRILINGFEDIICYPGCGVDITPCLLHCLDESYRFKINSSNNPLFIFCDPCFNFHPYIEVWESFCSVMNSEELIPSNLILDELRNTWYPNGITAWANPFYVGFTKTSAIHNPISGKEDTILYAELLVNDHKCRIITFPYTDFDMWQLFSFSELRVNGVFLWNEDKFDFYYDVINEKEFVNPEWVLMNRASKYGLSDYEHSLYDEVPLNPKEIEAINMVRYPEELRENSWEIDNNIRLYTLQSNA